MYTYLAAIFLVFLSCFAIVIMLLWDRVASLLRKVNSLERTVLKYGILLVEYEKLQDKMCELVSSTSEVVLKIGDRVIK